MSLLQRILDPGQPPVIVAELSGNHGQSIETAKSIIRSAAKAGADAVKLQTYTADSLTLPSDRPEFVVQGGLWDGQRLHDLYRKASTPYAWHAELASFAQDLGLVLFSTPFDEAAVDFLEESIDPPFHKVSSFELTHLPLLKTVAQTGKPVILSTGMGSIAEIREALETLQDGGCPSVTLLKCVSAYPSKPEGFNLRSMITLGDRFRCPIGLSDHTLTNEIATAATALGARLIEKHVTDSRAAGGVDAGFSLEPQELAELVSSTRRAHAALGRSEIQASPQDESQKQFRRSIYASADIQKGDTLGSHNLRIVRPSLGLAPKHWEDLLGQTAKRDIPHGHPLTPADL